MSSIFIPTVIEKTGQSERAYDLWSRLLKDRIIFLGTPINSSVANLIIAKLLFLKTEDAYLPINLYINSPGGCVNSTLAIYDTMRYLPCEIHTYAFGLVASSASLLLAAGTKGKRSSLPHARIMIHQPSGDVGGTSSDIEIQAKETLFLKNQMEEIFVNLTQQSKEKIARDCDRDYFMSPQEALQYGLIDKILTP